MPEPLERQGVHIRMTPADRKRAETLASEIGVTRTAVVRAACRLGLSVLQQAGARGGSIKQRAVFNRFVGGRK